MAVTEIIFCIAVLLTVVGSLLLFRAYFSRPVAFDPYCRRCGYNLRNRNRSREICPECGSDLTRRRAIRVGRREIWGPKSFLGLACLLMGIPPILAAAINAFAGFDLSSRMPLWMLLADASSGDTRVELSAWEEMQRRFDGSLLNQNQMSKILQSASPKVYSNARPASALMRDIWLADVVPAEVAREHLLPRFEPNLQVRHRVMLGDPIPLMLTYSIPDVVVDPAIHVAERNIRLQARRRDGGAAVDLAANPGRLSFSTNPYGRRFRSIELFVEAGSYADLLRAGHHQVELTLTVDVATPKGRIITCEVPCESLIELVAPIGDVAARSIPASAIAPNLSRPARLVRFKDQPPRFEIQLSLAHPDDIVYFDTPVQLYAADGDLLIPLDRTSVPAGRRFTSLILSNPNRRQLAALLRDNPKLLIKFDQNTASRSLTVIEPQWTFLWFSLKVEPSQWDQLFEFMRAAEAE